MSRIRNLLPKTRKERKAIRKYKKKKSVISVIRNNKRSISVSIMYPNKGYLFGE